MPCYHPFRAWRGRVLESGKREILFKPPAGCVDRCIELPCGQCRGCRLERSRQWAMRCVHEASLYERNCFLTLTYDDAHLPDNGSLVVRDFQLFMKRLRKAYPKDRIRFFHCGEYGEMFGRPHYHACVFNFDFPDKKLFSMRKDFPVYVSKSLSEIWGKGLTEIGSVTFESAGYVARYIMKKITGVMADEHYVNKDTGELRHPEYVTMSRRPGVGKLWYDKFRSDIYPSDFLISRGAKVRPPKYYDGQYEIDCPEKLGSIKRERVRKAMLLSEDERSLKRLRVKEEVKLAQIGLLKRSLEV